MSEFKGTKGEWYRNTESRIVSSVYSRNEQKLIRNEQKLIHISGGNTEEKKANAQLIAHAPKMLEMLKDIKDCLEIGNSYDVWRIDELIKQATTIK